MDERNENLISQHSDPQNQCDQFSQADGHDVNTMPHNSVPQQMVQQPTVPQPTVQHQTAQRPTAQQQPAQQPTVQYQTAQQPTLRQPMVSQPAVQQPTVQQVSQPEQHPMSQQMETPGTVAQSKQYSGMAITGFVLGLVSCFLNFTGIMGTLAIIFSSIGLAQTSGNGRKGKGMSIAGLVLGIINVLYAGIGVMFW